MPDGLIVESVDVKLARIESTMLAIQTTLASLDVRLTNPKTGFVSREVWELQNQTQDKEHSDIWRAISEITSNVSKASDVKESAHKDIWDAIRQEGYRFWGFVAAYALALTGILVELLKKP